MDQRDVLIELFGRVDGHVRTVLDGLTPADLTWRPATDANSIGWLVWHLSRVADHHVAELLDADQVWTLGSWAAGFGLEPDPQNTGYGHSPDEVAAVRPASIAALGGYFTRVAERTRDFLESVTPEGLDRIVDTRWNPPVTMGVRLVSIADDAIQHAGAAAYLKGILPR